MVFFFLFVFLIYLFVNFSFLFTKMQFGVIFSDVLAQLKKSTFPYHHEGRSKDKP